MATESKKPVKKTGPKNTDEMRAKKAAAKKRVEAKEKSKDQTLLNFSHFVVQHSIYFYPT